MKVAFIFLALFFSNWNLSCDSPGFTFFPLATAQEGVAPENSDGQKMSEKKDLFSETSESLENIRAYLKPFVYDSSVLRDPFSPPEIPIPLVKGEMYGPFLPLQSYRIEDLTLKGLIWNVKKPKAIVSAQDGKFTYRVGLKDYIGENFGYVAAIREKELVIVQTIEDDGHRYSTTKVMFFNNQRSIR